MFNVKMLDRSTGKVIENYEERFNTEEEAAEFLFTCEDNFNAGANTMALAGDDVIDPDDVMFVVDED